MALHNHYQHRNGLRFHARLEHLYIGRSRDGQGMHEFMGIPQSMGFVIK